MPHFLLSFKPVNDSFPESTNGVTEKDQNYPDTKCHDSSSSNAHRDPVTSWQHERV